MDETLTVTCRRCRRAFPTPLQVDRATLAALVLSNVYTCPRCGHTDTYPTAEHVHLLIVEGPPP